jgi:hypothetical protein
MTKAERRQYQADLEADAANAGAERVAAETRRQVSTTQRCPAALGRNHSFTMRGSDGVYRCWYCCKTRAEAGL